MFQLRHKFIYILLFTGGILFSTGISAQENESLFRDYEYNEKSQPWFSSKNVAGLQYLPDIRLSKGDIFLEKGSGDYINFHQSDDSYKIGAETESYYRLNERIVFYGKIKYSNFKGKNMGGSIFINPYDNPFDIIERADSNSGNKQMETYHLLGAVAANIYKGLNAGIKLDYETTNYAKHKDLRHTTKWLDLNFSAGISYRINSLIELGGNYNFRRSVEEIQLATYGNVDRRFYSLISYGAFFGQNEMFTSSGNGYTNTSIGKGNPLLNKYNGASFQLNLIFNPYISWYSEFTFAARKGHYGEKSKHTLYFTRHEGKSKEYSGTLSIKQNNHHHLLELATSLESLENYEMISQTETDSTGADNNSYMYYGEVEKLDRKTKQLKLGWTTYLGVNNLLPDWELHAGIHFHHRKQTASYYPYYRDQTINFYKIQLNATRNLVKGKNMYTFNLGALYGTGGGTPFYDGIYANSSESRNDPATLDNMLYREYEYLTQSHIRATAGVGYSRIFNNIQGFVRLQYELTQASKVKYLNGKSYNYLTFKVGCLF